MYLCHRFIEKSACPQHITVWGWVNKEWRKNFQPFFLREAKKQRWPKIVNEMATELWYVHTHDESKYHECEGRQTAGRTS